MLKNNSLNILILFILFVLFRCLIDFFALSSVASVDTVLKTDHDCQLELSYLNGFTSREFTEKFSFKSETIKKDTVANVAVPFHNIVATKLRFSPVPRSGRVEIFKIRIKSIFGDDIILTPQEIAKKYTVDSGTMVALTETKIVLSSQGGGINFVLGKRIHFNNVFLSVLLPAFLAIAVFLVLRTISIAKVYAIADITRKKPSSQQNIIALDGLRGFAALLVLADHTGYVYFKGLGGTGVWLFFVLSGFLLSTPFVKDPSKISSVSYVQHYFFRRIMRIVPMYYSVLIVNFIFSGDIYVFLRHILFLQGDSILWSVPQEMYFYMILPFILYVNLYIIRFGRVVVLLFMAFVVICMNHFFNFDFIYYYGNGQRMSLWIGIFFTGVFLSYLYHSSYIDRLKKHSCLLSTVLGLIVLGVVLFSSKYFVDLVFHLNIGYTWVYSHLYGYIAGLLLVFTILDNESALNKIMSIFPLRAVGVVGFSFYLLHPRFIHLTKQFSLHVFNYLPSGIPLFVIAGMLTYLFSIITYSLIERPFMNIGKAS